MKIDVSKVAEIIREAAKTEVMPRYQNLQKADVQEKKPDDPVTVADLASEKFLTEKLTSYLPGSLVVGEESVFKDIKVLEKFKEDNYVWVIDPIDGTRNFVSGKGRFGVLLALVKNNETLYGWVYDAITDRMFISQKGSGTYLEDKKIANLNTPDSLKDITLGCCEFFKHNVSTKPFEDTFKQVERMGCSVEFFTDLMSGKVDMLAALGSKNVWDCAAGYLAAEEIGAYIRMDEGRIYSPSFHGKAFLLLAPNENLWKQAHDLVYPYALNGTN